MSTRRAILLVLATTALAACAADTSDTGTEREGVGTLVVPLRTVEGTSTYFLYARFSVVGPVERTLVGDGSEYVMEDVPIGMYDVLIQDGWVLTRANTSEVVRVNATLTSSNPQMVQVESGFTRVPFAFRVGSQVIEVGGILRI